MFQSKKYIVQSGDTLTQIAKKFGLSSWKAIYDFSENTDLKKRRGSPDYIQVGDIIVIPPNPIHVLDYKIDRLNRLRMESESMYQQMLQQAEQSYRQIKSFGVNIDAGAALIQMGVGLSQLVKKGFDIMKLSGKELAKANSKLANDVLKDKTKSGIEQIVSISSLNSGTTGEEGLALAVTKIVVKSWFDMTSPSYWAQRISGVDIEQQHRQTRTHIQRIREKTLNRLDRKVIELRKEKLRLMTGMY